MADAQQAMQPGKLSTVAEGPWKVMSAHMILAWAEIYGMNDVITVKKDKCVCAWKKMCGEKVPAFYFFCILAPHVKHWDTTTLN